MQSYYPQTSFSDFISISNNDSTGKVFPNVCYKHFRYDSLDAIWTEGDTPPYKIMYRRIKKNYFSQEVEQKKIGNQIPQQLTLKQNYPNPFNSSTVIHYYLPNSIFTRLEIYNLLGQKVRTIVAENELPGEYQVQWDGRDDRGNLLPTGIYLCQLQTGKQKAVQKIAFIK